MGFTFGVITSDNFINTLKIRLGITWSFLQGRNEALVDVDADNPYFEYIVISDSDVGNSKSAWITRKKNLIAQRARFENIVFMHDYIMPQKDWFEGFEKFGYDWDVCMTRVLNQDGTRFRDWCSWDDPKYGKPFIQVEPWCPNGRYTAGSPHLVPYSYNNTSKMYVSGAYWVAKKQFMLDNPLDERLVWGEAEDVEWSLRVRDKWVYKMNPFSTVKLMKQKPLIIPEAKDD